MRIHPCFLSAFKGMTIISTRVEGAGARDYVVKLSKSRWMKEQPSETPNSWLYV